MKRPLHPFVDFMVYFALAVLTLGLLAVGIVLMLIFTIADGIARGVGRLSSNGGGFERR